MTVPIEASSIAYAGNGATLAFVTTFKFMADADLVVTLTAAGGAVSTKALGVDYTVAGAGVTAGGTVTMVVAPANGETLTITRTMSTVQGTAFRAQGTFSPGVHEDAFDHAAMIDQQLSRRITSLEPTGPNTGDVTLAAVGAAPSANGATIAGQVLTLQPADGTRPGLLSILAQVIAGAKTFLGAITASNLSGTNTGDVTIGTANGLSRAGQVLSMAAATAAVPGALTAVAQSIGGDKSFDGNINAGNLTGTNSGDVSLGAVGAAPNVNGASLAAQVLTLQPADGTRPGVVSELAQTFGGAKTFLSNVLASVFYGLPGVNAWVLGQVANGAAAIGVKISNSSNLTNATAKIAAFYPDNGVTEKLAVDKDGKLINPTGGAADVAGKSAAMVTGLATVNTTAVTANSIIKLTHAGTGVVGNFGSLYVGTITAGTSFQIKSTNGADTDAAYWEIRN